MRKADISVRPAVSKNCMVVAKPEMVHFNDEFIELLTLFKLPKNDLR